MVLPFNLDPLARTRSSRIHRGGCHWESITATIATSSSRIQPAHGSATFRAPSTSAIANFGTIPLKVRYTLYLPFEHFYKHLQSIFLLDTMLISTLEVCIIFLISVYIFVSTNCDSRSSVPRDVDRYKYVLFLCGISTNTLHFCIAPFQLCLIVGEHGVPFFQPDGTIGNGVCQHFIRTVHKSHLSFFFFTFFIIVG